MHGIPLEGTSTHARSKPLDANWMIRSSDNLHLSGEVISTSDFQPQGWMKATIPSTVLGAEVAAGKYPDPFLGMNLRQLPGGDYPYGKQFSNLEMPARSPYRSSWWYRKEFVIPHAAKDARFWLHFAGINYRANIWVNGHQLADASQIAGAYRIYDLDVTTAVTPGRSAVLAVEVFAPGPKDLGINWVDWNPTPPDKDMGLYGAVDLVVTGPVAVRSPFVSTHFEDPNLNVASVNISARVQNATDKPIDGDLSGTLSGASFAQAVHLKPGESREIVFSPHEYPQLRLAHASVWWPAEMGRHPLVPLSLKFASAGVVSDTASAQVGLREVTSELSNVGTRRFLINGKPLLIRGAGWSQDLMMREDHEQLPRQFKMVSDMHLNTIRLEGKLETETFFSLADQYGLLVMAGWCCCDQWEHWADWTPENHQVATASLRDQLLRLRAHPSVFVWLNGSDLHPPADVEQAYLDVEKEIRWPNPILSSATSAATTVTGINGVKMTGPYDYVDPSYWLVDRKHGGAVGFNTETSPGAAIPLTSSLRRFLPAKNLWPADDTWSFHTGSSDFANLNKFNKAMQQMYGQPDDLQGYDRVSQTMAYEGERAMFEAYGRNKYAATGVIQWMLNNAWPSMIWHLYDYYLQPGGGYFGTKLACEPLHIQYSYDDQSIYVVNSTQQSQSALSAEVTVYDLQSRPVFHQNVPTSSSADTPAKVTVVPQEVISTGDSVHFVQLKLSDAQGKLLSQNFYWVPAKPTVYDWDQTDYTQTPAKAYADMRALAKLPKASITANARFGSGTLRISLTNKSPAVAFQVQVTTSDGSDKLLPLLWSDNYISLMPGESREIDAALPEGSTGEGLRTSITGWNTSPLLLKPSVLKP